MTEKERAEERKTEVWEREGRHEGERTVRRKKKIKKARELWGETQSYSVV